MKNFFYTLTLITTILFISGCMGGIKTSKFIEPEIEPQNAINLVVFNSTKKDKIFVKANSKLIKYSNQIVESFKANGVEVNAVSITKNNKSELKKLDPSLRYDLQMKWGKIGHNQHFIIKDIEIYFNVYDRKKKQTIWQSSQTVFGDLKNTYSKDSFSEEVYKKLVELKILKGA